ncbi:hypothetical protein [Cobetia marina]|uniref:hypothetical protein n=1 Tax=Cobetia marina TaxID=28258 RepID=UPI003A8DBC37
MDNKDVSQRSIYRDESIVSNSFNEEVVSRERDLRMYTAELRKREIELENHSKKLNQQQLDKEKFFQKEIAEREKLFKERERELNLRQKKIERAYREKIIEADKVRERLNDEMAQKDKELKQLLIEAEKERERYREETRNTIETKSEKFVSSALELLSNKEARFHKIAWWWSFIGVVSIVLSIGFAIFTMINSASEFHRVSNSTSLYFVYSLFRGLVVVSLFGILSRYAFVLSNSFMHESLKSGERLHAIKFGEFYLDAYGADAEWDQLKEAFEHWNISGGSAFSKKEKSMADNGVADTVLTGVEKMLKSSDK